MATNVVNLDALIPREDLAIKGDPSTAPARTTTIRVSDLESAAFFFSALRKPDFQRETSNWTPQKIADFVKTFLDEELIPAIILWSAGENVFVIDGAHRLSALIAWVNNDYGDGESSRDFFKNNIPLEQLRAADRTRTLLNKAVGSYIEHKVAVQHPENSRPEIVSRAKRLGSLALELQWVRASNAEKAEASFFKINQEATPIDATELMILKSRKSPNAIAARAIVRSGTGHQYWSHFNNQRQNEITRISREIYEALYVPNLQTPIKTLDLPVAGRGYGAQTLPLIFDLVNLANNHKMDSTKPAPKNSSKITVLVADEDGSETIKFLSNTQRLINRISSTAPGSLGLHPALYFYGRSGNYQPSALLGAVSFIKWLDETNKYGEFTKSRQIFEEFLLKNKDYIGRVVHKYGSGGRSIPWVSQLYQRIFKWINEDIDDLGLLEKLTQDTDFVFLTMADPLSEGKSRGNAGGEFTRNTKSATFLKEALDNAIKCKICGGLLHVNSITVDHIHRRVEGGSSSVENAQMSHPYCNTTYKN